MNTETFDEYCARLTRYEAEDAAAEAAWVAECDEADEANYAEAEAEGMARQEAAYYEEGRRS